MVCGVSSEPSWVGLSYSRFSMGELGFFAEFTGVHPPARDTRPPAPPPARLWKAIEGAGGSGGRSVAEREGKKKRTRPVEEVASGADRQRERGAVGTGCAKAQRQRQWRFFLFLLEQTVLERFFLSLLVEPPSAIVCHSHLLTVCRAGCWTCAGERWSEQFWAVSLHPWFFFWESARAVVSERTTPTSKVAVADALSWSLPCETPLASSCGREFEFTAVPESARIGPHILISHADFHMRIWLARST